MVGMAKTVDIFLKIETVLSLASLQLVSYKISNIIFI
jgi:hypothetical protein